MDYTWDFRIVADNFPILLRGVGLTIELWAIALTLGMLLGFFIGLNLDPYAAAVLALSTQSGAFYAEVFRGGILSIERGQWEGAQALGMTRTQALRRVVVPQALRRMIAPFIERSFELTKTTALASTLAYAELLYQAQQVNSITFRPMEVYTTIAVMYFIMLFAASNAMRLLEYRLARVG